MHEPNARVAVGDINFSAVAGSGTTSANFYVQSAGGAQTLVGAGTSFGLAYAITFHSTTKADGYWTATCQATGTGGTGVMSTAVPFVIHNAATALPGPLAKKRGSLMGFNQTLAHSDEIDGMAAQRTGWYRGGFEFQWLINKDNDTVHGGSAVRTNPSTWAWDVPAGTALSYDDEVAHTHALGMKFLAVAMGTPYFANSAGLDGHYYPTAANIVDWQRYIKGLIDHGADAIEVWNEPNIAPSFVPTVDPATQAGLVRYTYDYVKSYAPDVTVVSAGLAAFAGANFCTYPMFDVRSPIWFTIAEYAAAPASYNSGRGFAGSFDAMGWHPYAGPTTMPGSGGCEDGVTHTNDLFAIMQSFGDVKPFWMTEYGNKALETSPANLGPYMQGYQDGFNALRADGVPVQGTFEYNLHNGSGEASDPEQSFGVYKNDWTEKPSAAPIRDEALLTRDTSAPKITLITVTVTGSTTATVTWTTDDEATSGVQFGTTTAYGNSASGDSGTTHSVDLTGLVSGTTVHYAVESYNGWGDRKASNDKHFVMP